MIWKAGAPSLRPTTIEVITFAISNAQAGKPAFHVNNYVNNVLKRVAGVLKTGVEENEAKGFFTRKGAFLSLFYT